MYVTELKKSQKEIIEKLNISLDLRPQNINLNTYYKLTQEYEKLTC